MDTPLAAGQVLEAAKDSFEDAVSVAKGLLRAPADKVPAETRATLQGWVRVAMTNVVAMGLMLKARVQLASDATLLLQPRNTRRSCEPALISSAPPHPCSWGSTT